MCLAALELQSNDSGFDEAAAFRHHALIVIAEFVDPDLSLDAIACNSSVVFYWL